MLRYTALVFFAWYFALPAFAQTSGPFDSYDCRSEIEIIRLLEREKQLKEQARLDSIAKAQQQLQLATQVYFIEDTINGWRLWTVVPNYAFGKNRGELPMITALEALHPYFRDKVLQLIQLARAKGIELAVVETYRTRAKQAEYKSMGKRYTRTGAGNSKHQYGLAIDLVPIVNGQAQWHNMQLWRKVGVIGERLGLRWGGRWRSPFDPGHFEWTAGLGPDDLAKGKMPAVPKKELQYPCLEDDLKLLKKYWNEWEVSQSSLARQQR
ncbi:MAG: M15 family metallopeptidase [Cyclobacteriaceae bacterium]|nr:M15 family metallopeptidase [Cyclobacteriaceae bacterium]